MDETNKRVKTNMQIKKFVATGLSALMAGVTIAGGALAAPMLSDYPSFLGSNGNLDAYVVVGSAAAPQDVVGAIDVAASLASLSYSTVSTTGGSTSVTGITGLIKDGVALGNSNGGASLTTGTNAFPSSTIKNAQFSGLWQGTLNYNSTTYNAHEEVDVSGVHMRHDLGTDKINGTEKVEINTGADVVARYKFDTAIPLQGGSATVSSPKYDNPLKVTFLGKEFTIVGVGTDSIKMLSGTVGTAVKDGSADTADVAYGNYKVAVTAGSDGAWSTLVIKDSTGATVDTLTNAKPGDTKQSVATGLDVKVTSVRVTGTDPSTQHIEVDLVVGPTGQTEVEYTSTADISTSSKVRFPGETDWYVTYTSNGGSAGTIANGASINVEYRPSTDVYLTAGQKLSLPNNYGELGYDGFNTGSFSTVTVQPYGPATVYNSTDNALLSTTLYGLQISTDGNSIGSGNLATPNWYPSMYLLFNQTVTSTGGGNSTTYLPVMVGYTNSNGHIQINDTLSTAAAGAIVGTSAATELPYAYLNASTGSTASATFPFKLNYNGGGQDTWYANITVTVPSVNGATNLANVTLGSSTSADGYAVFENKTVFNANGAQLSSTLFKLGSTSSSAEDTDVNVTTEGSTQYAGKKSQEIVGDAGILYEDTVDNSASDKLVVKIPSKALQNVVHLGAGAGATSITTSGGTVKQVVPITNAVAKLDTEVGDAEKAKNLVLVGGPAVNSLTAAAMGLTYPSYGAASGIPENAALIKLVDGAFTTGKVAVIVAGWEAADTRLATSLLQQASTKLAGVTDTAVTVTGTSVADAVVAPVVAAPATSETTTANATQ